MVPNIPNFILYLLFGPLGDKLKDITGHDIIKIDLLEIVKDIKIPALFFVTDNDTVSGTSDVTELYEKYGGKLFSD